MNSYKKEDSERKFSLIDRLKSFRSALSGLIALFKYEHNARIHLFILILVIAAGVFLRISPFEWIAVIFVTGLVFASECFNTAVENLSDVISPGQDDKIKTAKDVAAAGVLISAAAAVVTGIIIFLPKIIRLIAG